MITNKIFEEVLGKSCPVNFTANQPGLVNTRLPSTLIFIDDARFVDDANSNDFVTVVLTTAALADAVKKTVIIVEDPRYDFYTLHNFLARKNKTWFETKIDATASIHTSVFVAGKNVIIGANTIVLPNATILEDVEIGDNCIIGAGAVIGAEGFEYKRTSKGVLNVYHDGKVIIHNNVHIGANTCIDKGLLMRHTKIENDVKVDNLVHIGHGAHIGERCFIAANAQIGAVNMGNDVWIGPSVNLLSKQNIGDFANITVGSLVTKDVEINQKVTGYFAVEHQKFLKDFKKRLE